MSEPSAEDWEAVSLLLEQATGYDSIPTIVEHYSTGTGSFRCVWPGCKFTRNDPYDMWRHVHFGHPRGDGYPPHPFGDRSTYAELCELAEQLGTRTGICKRDNHELCFEAWCKCACHEAYRS